MLVNYCTVALGPYGHKMDNAHIFGSFPLSTAHLSAVNISKSHNCYGCLRMSTDVGINTAPDGPFTIWQSSLKNCDFFWNKCCVLSRYESKLSFYIIFIFVTVTTFAHKLFFVQNKTAKQFFHYFLYSIHFLYQISVYIAPKSFGGASLRSTE